MPDLPLRGDDFELLVLGKFNRSELEVDYDPQAYSRCSGPTIDALIDETWTRAMQARGEALLTDQSKFRLADFVLTDRAHLRLHVGLTGYKDYWGTNRQRKTLFQALEHHRPEDHLANPIAVNVAILTSDNQILVGVRSQHVAEHAGYFHVPGGHVEPSDGPPDMFAAIGREVFEELGIPAEQLLDLHCHGLVRPIDTWKPELVFGARVERATSEIKPRNEEHVQFMGADFDRDSILRFVVANRAMIVPTAKASIVAFGASAFGAGWLAQVLGELQTLT